MKTLITILMVLAIGGGMYFLTAPKSANGPEASPSPTVSVSPTSSATKTPTPKPKTPTPTPVPTPGILIQESTVHNVSIAAFQYNPTSVTAKRGDVVVFRNRDGTPHTVTADNGVFDSGTIENEGRWELTTVNLAPGTYAYHCAFHPEMHGMLIIQ